MTGQNASENDFLFKLWKKFKISTDHWNEKILNIPAAQTCKLDIYLKYHYARSGVPVVHWSGVLVLWSGVQYSDMWAHYSDLQSHYSDLESQKSNLKSHYSELESHYADLWSHYSDLEFHYSDLGLSQIFSISSTVLDKLFFLTCRMCRKYERYKRV